MNNVEDNDKLEESVSDPDPFWTRGNDILFWLINTWNIAVNNLLSSLSEFSVLF